MRPLRAAAALAALLALAGCASIPTAGPVVPVAVEQPNDPTQVYLPQGPADDADQQAIVSGFVVAASAGDDYAVAREYLTPEFAATWRPNERVLVHQRSWTTTQEGDARVLLSVPASARVDEGGNYTPSMREWDLPFDLERVRGQWRIASAPDGIVVLQDIFQQRIFEPQTLQFFDPTFTRLVPDLRWFPVRASQTRRVIRGLLDGPSSPLSPSAGVTVSAFPEGTELEDVTPGPGTTTISITMPGEQPDAETTARMQQQLALSLPLSSTSPLRLVVNGRRVPPAQQLPAVPLDPRPFVLTGERFGPLDSSGVAEEPVLGPRIAAAQPTAVTISPRQRLAALRTRDGVAIVDPDAMRVVDRRPGLVGPTIDQRGWTYSVPSGSPGAMIAYSPKGVAAPIPTRLGSGSISTIEASPDGTRMLVLVHDGAASDAFVVGIERSADGSPTGFTSSRYPVELGPDPATSATWVDDGSVAVLTSGTDRQSVVVQQLGGLSSTLGRLPSTVSAIVGTTGQNELRVLTSNTGDLYERGSDSTAWQQAFRRPVEVTVLAVQR